MNNITDQYYTLNVDKFNDDTLHLTSKMQRLYDRFLQLLPTNLVLDLGCGTGRDSLYFQTQSLIVTSVDQNKAMIIKCIDNGVENPILASFDQFQSDLRYGGVWACASLLHLSKSELPAIFDKIADMMIEQAVFYCSFKYGDFEGIRNGRLFSDMTEHTFEELIDQNGKFEIVEMFVSGDVRNDNKQRWLNVYLKKK